MKVIRVEPGQDEPEGEDYVMVDAHPSGGFAFSGTVAFHLTDVASMPPSPAAALASRIGS